MVKASLIDLSFLTEEERKRITEVLNRDAKIQQKEEARIRHLQNKAARTKNETIKKKIKMRSGEWFWELAGKQGGLKRSDTATASVRASLRIRQKETKKANKPTSSLTEVGGDISSDYNKTESRKNGFSVDVHQTNIATQDNRLGEADVSNTTESPEREQSSSTSRSSEKVTRQEAVDDRAILPSSEEHDESNEDSSYFVANHPYADSENTHQSFPLELSKGDGDGEMWNNSLSAERGIPSIVVKGPSVTDDVSERSSDRSSSRDYSSDSEHSYSSSDDKSSSGEDAPRTIAKEYYIDNVTTATKNDENKHEATSQEIITHHSSSADQKESEELFKPMPRAEAVAVVVANTITERTEDVSVHELSENDTASVKSEKYHSEEDEKSRRSSSSSSSSESRKSDAGDNVAEDILEDEADQSPLLQQPSPAYDISQGNNPYKDVVSEFQGLLVQKKLVEAEKSTDSESDPEKRSQSPSLPCSIEENETVSCVNQTEAVQDFTNQIEATETSINPSGIVSQFDEKNFIPDENVKEIITYTSSVEEPFVHIDFVLESSQDESVEVCTTPAEIMEESTPDSETEDKRSTPSTSDSDTGETTTDSETEDKSSNVAEIVKESTSDSETEKKSSTPSESVEENATETEEKNTTPADRIEETTSDSETEEKSSMPAEIVKESASDSETEKRSSTPSTSVEESTSDSETEEKSSIPAEIVKESASDSEKKSSTPSESVEENASETEEKSTTPTFTIEEITSDSETEEKSSISAESVRENEYHSIIVEECTAQDHSAKESTPQYEFVLENATQCETEKESGTQDETAENTMSLVETAEDSTIHDETSQRNPAKDDVAKQSLAEHSEESFAHVVTTINISATTESDEEAYTRTDTAEGSETHVLSRVSPSSVEVQDEGEASPIPVVETNQASTRIPSISVDETDKRESTPRKERNVSESGSDTGSLGKSTPILTSSLSLKPHFGSSWSVHSSAGAIRSDIEITGHVELSFDYAHKTGTFNVNVGSCKDLASADKKKLSNPYVKTYLLPDKNSKRKTKAKKKTLNPEYNETLKYTISESQLQTRTLNVAVWHDKVGVNVFLGEVNIDLSMHDVNSSKKMKIYYLQPKYDESNDTFEKYLGEINIALRLSMHGQSLDTETSEGELEIVMKNVSNVSTDLSNHNIYVKSYFLPDKAHATKQKTPSMPAKNKIDFDHLFMYTNVRAKELDQRCVELTIWQQHKFGANNLLGGVRVGSGTVVDDKSPAPWMDCTFEEVDVWKKMKQKVGQWVEGHLNLRTITPSK